jgi:hypothetical protein
MTRREADLGKRRRYADDRGFVGWVPSLTTPPSSPGWSHVHSLLGAAYHERFGFPCQNLYGSCASRPIDGAYPGASVIAVVLMRAYRIGHGVEIAKTEFRRVGHRPCTEKPWRSRQRPAWWEANICGAWVLTAFGFSPLPWWAEHR